MEYMKPNTPKCPHCRADGATMHSRTEIVRRTLVGKRLISLTSVV